MLSRRTILGSLAVLGVGLITTVAAFAHGGGGRGPAMMKRMVSAAIDEALEPANVTPDQRAKIYATRDRAFAAIHAQHQTRGARMEQVLAIFEADTIDPARLAALAAQREAEQRQIADAIAQSITEVHDVLTPVQRRAVADWLRTHRPGGHGG
jgi:Spy/CpxP family protein refolding chaperone